jgi:branched-chain amino acid transport system permease protein
MSGGTETLLEVQQVSKAFIGVQALLEMTFTVQRGEILGISGPQGAGKTTLLNVLNGFLVPDQGRIVMQGRDLTGLHPGAVCHRGISRTFQVARPFVRLSVLENVMIGAFARQRSLALAQRQARMALARVGLQRYAAWPVTGLSPFDLRLLELARCLATQPRLLLLDEPLAGLNGDDLKVLLPLLRHVRQQGITMVISDPTLPILGQVSDRLVVLDHGGKVAEGTPEEVIHHPLVIAAYQGQDRLAAN